jgi:hypothetical protein
MNKKVTFIALIAVIILAGLVFVFRDRFISPRNLPISTGEKNFTSEMYGISFTIPEGYALLEGQKPGAGAPTYSYVIIDSEEFERPRRNGEAAPSISIDVFDTKTSSLSLPTWFHTNPSSNSNLTYARSYATTTFAGRPAIGYRWSGLYEGETLAFIHKDYLIALNVSYIDAGDKNIPAFRKLMESLKLK